jgi:hypothetical protein
LAETNSVFAFGNTVENLKVLFRNALYDHISQIHQIVSCIRTRRGKYISMPRIPTSVGRELDAIAESSEMVVVVVEKKGG